MVVLCAILKPKWHESSSHCRLPKVFDIILMDPPDCGLPGTGLGSSGLLPHPEGERMWNAGLRRNSRKIARIGPSTSDARGTSVWSSMKSVKSPYHLLNIKLHLSLKPLKLPNDPSSLLESVGSVESILLNSSLEFESCDPNRSKHYLTEIQQHSQWHNSSFIIALACHDVEAFCFCCATSQELSFAQQKVHLPSGRQTPLFFQSKHLLLQSSQAAQENAALPRRLWELSGGLPDWSLLLSLPEPRRLHCYNQWVQFLAEEESQSDHELRLWILPGVKSKPFLTSVSCLPTWRSNTNHHISHHITTYNQYVM